MKFLLSIFLFSTLPSQSATISHRWSFDSDTTDSVSGNTGSLQGGASIEGGQLILPGTGTSTAGNRMIFTNPVDIGGNFGASGVTIETWYTDTGTGTWGKLFQFGNNTAAQAFGYTHVRGNGEQSGIDRDGTKQLGEQVTVNEEHHLVITVSADGNLNAWVDGDKKINNTDTNDLSNVTTNFEAIGATSWNDPGMKGTVNEFRIWSGELTAAEVASNLSSGPDSPPGNGPLISSFTTSHATRREGETATLSWDIDDSNLTGSLNLEIRDPANPIIHSASTPTGSTDAIMGDTGGILTTFTYTLNIWDSNTPETIQTRTLNIEVDPGLPTAPEQSFQTIETTPLALTLAGTDPNAHPNPTLVFSILSPPSSGTLTGTAPNLTYIANNRFIGTDSFNFTANDGKYDSAPATVTIVVDQSPTAPLALSLNTLTIPITVANGGYLAALTTSDPNLLDTHSYSLVSGAGSTDNTLFSIVGNQLRAATDFSGQTGISFSIRLRTTDQGGLFSEQSFTLQAIEPSNEIVINEIHPNPPENQIRQEFIELHNPSTSPKDLSNWRLSSAIDFTFPANTTILPGGYLVIAEDPATLQSTLGVTALGPFQGSLNSSGETVRLRDASDVVIDEVDYKVGFPWPVASDGGGASIELINPSLDNSLGSSWRASIPQITLPEATLLNVSDSSWSWRPGTTEASSPTSSWRAPTFSEDPSWSQNAQAPVGYGNVNGLTLNTSVPEMRSNFNSIFLRNTFTISPGQIPSQLLLNFTADDGLVVWINGTEVTRQRFDENEAPTIDDLASSNGSEGQFEEKLILNAGSFLNEGPNTIAVHLFNATTASSDLGFDLAVLRPSSENALPQPSPGAPNITFAQNAAPNIRKVNHTPEQPTSTDPVLITAQVTDPDGIASVSLEYRIIAPGDYLPARLPLPIIGNTINTTQTRPANPDFETGWTTVAMLDDASNGDTLAGDDLFSATLPAAAHRHLVRYRITITDTLGEAARVPYSDDLSLNFAYFVYDGVPAYQDIDATTMADTLPVYHFLIRNEDYDEAVAYNGNDQINQGTEARFLYNWNGSMVYDGKVYDNIRFRLRGANGRYQGRGKRSMRVRFNDGDFLEARDQNGKKFSQPWRTLTLGKGNSNRSTMTFGLNEAVNYHLFQKLGIPAANPLYIQWRVVDDAAEAPDQWRGDYQGTSFVSETYDVRFLEEHGLDKGNLYKLINQTQDWKKQQRYQSKFAPFDGRDISTIENNLDGNDTPAYLEAHVNLDKYYAFHALVEATRHYDYWPSANKNMVYYFEPDYLPANDNKGKLWILPWDTDSSWGPTYNSGHDVIYNSLFNATGGGSDNASNPTLWPAYYNSVREMRDLLWQEDQINQVIDDFATIIAPLVPADFARWKNAPNDAGNYNHLGGPGINSLDGYVQDMKNFAFTGGSWPGGNNSVMPQANDNGLSGTQGRDAWLDFHQAENGEGSQIPNTPILTYTGPANFPTNALSFQTTAFSDPQGNGTFGALEWRLADLTDPSALEITASWESGELTSFANAIGIPTAAVRSGSTYRARVRHQDATGRWSHWSDPVEFTTTLPDISNYLESLVITEVMYHPTDPTPAEIAAGFDNDDLFEYLELKNVGTTPLDLSDIRFTKGIDFDFINAAQTTLNPGQVILVVHSIPAFEMRYGSNHLIAGAWDPTDKLSNKSDRVKLSFGAGDTIRDFTYLDTAPWPIAADGNGNSLTLLNPATVPDHALASSWRASFSSTGTPGLDESDAPFADWLSSRGQTDPDAAFNGSSLTNLLAYSLGADLLTTGIPLDALPTFSLVEDGGNSYPALSYRIRQGSNPISYLVEVSDTLETWQSGPAHTSQLDTITDNGDGTSTLTVRSATTLAARQFLRLRVILP
jgi:hypothetical protein